jgi:hypothetical protein
MLDRKSFAWPDYQRRCFSCVLVELELFPIVRAARPLDVVMHGPTPNWAYLFWMFVAADLFRFIPECFRTRPSAESAG